MYYNYLTEFFSLFNLSFANPFSLLPLIIGLSVCVAFEMFLIPDIHFCSKAVDDIEFELQK